MGTVDIQAVERVGNILALFGTHRDSVTSAEAADLIGLNRTTTYRYLASLVAADVLELRPDRTYGPGPTLLQLGALALGRRDVMHHAPEPMSDLAQRTGITSVLSLWGSKTPVVAHVEEPPEREIVVTVKVGMHLSSTAAQTKIFHAFAGSDARVRRAARVLSAEDREALEQEAEATREAGYASQVSPRGIAVLAAPVRDSGGMVASLALLSTRDVLDSSASGEHVRLLLESARVISSRLGTEPAHLGD